jgi:long-chain acyl-CoA synthetase
LQKTGSFTHTVYDKVFFAKTREALGGRVRIMLSGSAPLLPEVQNLLKVCMCAPLCEGYGSTESTGGMLFTDGLDPEVKQVGGPLVNYYRFRLISKLNL